MLEEQDKEITTTPKNQIVVTDEFKEALYRIFNNKQNLLLLGDAGSGKSTFIKILKRNIPGNAVYLAPTGIAAVNIKGQTIHSFFSFPPKPISIYDLNFKPDKLELLRSITTIVIDEISMVRVDVFEGINYAMQIAKSNNAPFGGVQMICIGDLSQLPPVLGGEADKDLIGHMFKSAYFFDAPCYEKAEFHKMRFTKVFRQTDIEFISFLNRVKHGDASFDDIRWFNDKVKGPTFKANEAINLVTTNAMAEEINSTALSMISAELETFSARIDGSFDPRSTHIPQQIEIKKGARLMTLVNDSAAGYYNGTCGIYVGTCTTDNGFALKIRLDDGNEIYVNRKEFQSIKYDYEKESSKVGEKVLGSFTQFPVKLAFATTIHKAQGMTFDRMNLDLGRSSFAHGLTYVAISRCRSLDGIRLKRPMVKSDIVFDFRILDFIKNR